ncbi:MAG: DEAD/DEAH box helicase [Acidimicrobiia bacterium]|nr:DEAD/DEAH box helicase [Acidimicrobiia bacterium]
MPEHGLARIGGDEEGGLPSRPGRDGALDAALERLAPGRRSQWTGSGGEPGGEIARPDTPDLHVTAVRRLPPTDARTVPFPDILDARLRAALTTRGIRALYTHQAESLDHALAGRNVVVVTPTASGKTLCYNAPILHQVLQDPSSRALYLFPTKALAQDQLAELQGLCETIAGQTEHGADQATQIGVFTYDGDTPQDARRSIRTRAHLVLSNPDMVHSGILPHHPRWAKLFENLRYIVIDELHAYRGVFGSHLCNVLRRLRRICRHYGSDPVFLCSSATIANPRELAERLLERPCELVDQSGAPRGEKYFVFVNPPVVNNQLGIRRSYLSETRRVASEFLKRSLQIIVFAQSRLATEILTTYLKDDFENTPGAPERIRGYRGGYLPMRRRQIEKGLRDGEVRAVVSTNALELGIDIGALDVSVMAGYPGTVAATWQRAGRAGRRASRSAAVMVASSAPLDQFIVRNPSYFFDRSPERALIDPDNLHILVDHVKCAAFELPFGTNEHFGCHNVQEVLSVLAEQGFVHRVESEEHAPDAADDPADEGSWTWTSESYPANAISLRSVSSDNFVIVDTTREPLVIGETDFTSGPSTLHPKAIYIVEAKLYQVEKLDFDGRKAFVREIECDYYTDAIRFTRVTILDTFEQGGAEAPPCAGGDADEPFAPEGAGGGERPVPRASVGVSAVDASRSHGEVHVVSRVVGFKKIKFYTNENVGSGELDLPEQQMHTTSYWLTIPAALMAKLPFASDDRRDGISGLAFALGQIAQLLLMCDRHDIGISIDTGEQVDPAVGIVMGSGHTLVADRSPRIFIYDNYPGGIGFSRPLYRMHAELLESTQRLIAECECENGCPGCVGPVGQTGPLAKVAALRILSLLIDERQGEPGSKGQGPLDRA